MSKFLLITSLVLNFLSVDREFKYECDYQGTINTLEIMLEKATTPEDRAEVLWRLSRSYLMLGELAETKESKREYFNIGIEYANNGIAEDPDNIYCYMWHCANVGRECQTHSLMDQAAAVPVMTEDLTKILDELNHPEFSEAWQALSEMYYHHPFKSNESAINFARMAAMNIPKDELRISTYVYFANLLIERDWSEKKRKSMADGNRKKFEQEKDSNIEKYSNLDGSDFIMPWSGKYSSEGTDMEEAKSVLNFAKQQYDNATIEISPIDKKDYEVLKQLINSVE